MKRGSEMTAEKATAQEATRKVAFAKVLAIQIIAYVVLVALALVPGMMYGDAAKPAAVPFTIIASLAMIALLVVFSPFRDGVAGHVIAAIAGLLSAICATTVMLGNVIFPAGLDGGKSFSMEEAWIAGVGGLLIVLIIVSFGRQMARENRTHLIRSLSHSVVEGAAMIASRSPMTAQVSFQGMSVNTRSYPIARRISAAVGAETKSVHASRMPLIPEGIRA